MSSHHAAPTPGERASLKAQAHALKPVVMIGPEGLTDAVIHEIDLNLKAHTLIKIRMFENIRTQREETYQAICARLGAHPIQHIGKLFVIWRPDSGDNTQNASAKSTHRSGGAPPRKAIVFKRRPSSLRRTTRKTLQLLGNQRVTQGGNVKRAKPRLSSIKKKF